jgi:hypothetical protein
MYKKPCFPSLAHASCGPSCENNAVLTYGHAADNAWLIEFKFHRLVASTYSQPPQPLKCSHVNTDFVMNFSTPSKKHML